MYPDGWTRNVDIVSARRQFKIEFEYLNRAWNMDVRFTLHDGEAVIASVDCCHAKKLFHRASMCISASLAGEIARRPGIFAIHDDVLRGGQTLGRIHEKPGLAWRRRIFIDTDGSVDVPIQFFLFFLVSNYAFHGTAQRSARGLRSAAQASPQSGNKACPIWCNFAASRSSSSRPWMRINFCARKRLSTRLTVSAASRR